MRTPTLILTLLLISAASFAQRDSLVQVQDSVLQKMQVKKLDSLEQGFTQKSDSIKQAYASKKQKLVALKDRYRSRIDSLKNKQRSDNPLDTLANVQQQVTYTKKIDSLDRKLEAVQQQTTARIDSLKGNVSAQLTKLKLPKQALGKVKDLTAVMDKVNVPAFDQNLSGKLGMPDVSGNIPALPGADVPGVTIPNADLPDINGKLPGGVSSPDLKSNLPTTDLNTGKLGEITGKAGDVQQQVGDLKSPGGIDKAVENQAADKLKGLPDKNMPTAPGMPEGGIPKTGDEAKEQLVQLGKKEAINHFAGKEEVLMSAIDKMSKYKQKYSSVSSLKDIEHKKNHNELKGKPLRDRLVPSITWQFQSWQDLMLDVNPAIGYKFTPRITAGIGYNHRIAFNIPDRSFNREARVSGFRTFGEYTLKKGFGFRLDVEAMNAPLRETMLTVDEAIQRDWVWSALVGVKQKYPIYKKLKGNAQVMYNLFDRDHRSPYTDRINFRIGVEFTFKKKPVKTSTSSDSSQSEGKK